MDAEALILLKKIKDRLTWVVVFLILILLNTCSLDDRISDAIGNSVGDQTPAADTPASTPAPAPTASQE